MKEVILIKQCPAIQLAHLYEHLFCSRVDELFYAQGLFPYLDYTLTGRTHQSGIIYICLESYTKQAAKVADGIDRTKIDLSDNALSIAASQLIAEHEHAYSTTGIEQVKRHLTELDDVPWQNLDSLTSIDTTGIRRQGKPYHIDVTQPLPAKKLSVSICVGDTLTQDLRHLLPLFRLYCFFISETIETRLADVFGIYPTGGKFNIPKSGANYTSLFNIPNGDEIDSKLILAAAESTIGYIRAHRGFERFAKELANTSYMNSPRVAPNALHNLTDTGILEGSRGWKEVATTENVERILDGLMITVKKGRSRIDGSMVQRPKN